MKSDVLPAIAAGAFGVHIPYHVTWAHELADAPVNESRYTSLSSIADLKDTIDSWCTESISSNTRSILAQ